MTPPRPVVTPPRLLYVATSRNDGGLERYSVLLAARLAARGVTVRFACAPGEIVETLCRASGVQTLPLSARNSADWSCARALAAFIAAHEIDIVHVHSRRDYVTAAVAAKLARCPRLILHAHMLRPLGSPRRLSGRFFRWGAALALANSRTVRDFLVDDQGLPDGFVRLLRNGVALERFAPPGSPEAAARRRRARGEWGVSDGAPVLGMVGRLDAKGQAALLGVVPDLLVTVPSLRVVLIGSEGLIGERARLTTLAGAGGFADRLVFTGPREDVPALLPGLDALVHLPSDESFGLALAEAMAAGLPTVAADIPACREVVRDGETGRLVAPGDAAALSGALLRLLDPAGGAARRREMGLAGRRAAESGFSLDRQVDRLQEIYQEVYAKRQAR